MLRDLYKTILIPPQAHSTFGNSTKVPTEKRDATGHYASGYVGGYSFRNISTGIAANQPVSGTAGLGSGNYRSPKSYIPIGQGFFVTGSGTGGTITFNNAQREYKQEGDDADFIKTEDQQEPIPRYSN